MPLETARLLKQPIHKSDLTVGTLFRIPVGDGQFYTGQIVGFNGPSPYVVIYKKDIKQSDAIPTAAFDRSEACLATETMNVRLLEGEWEILGTAPVKPCDHLPAYRLGADFSGGVVIEDFHGKLRWASTDAEADQLNLNFRSTMSDTAVQRAAEALAGHAKWLPGFNKVLPENIALARDIFG